MPTSVLSGLGQALRWLRDRQGKKQYQVADAAGITKGMLSAYETGRQRPSLETLEKLLDTLGCDLHDLHNAIQIVNGRPQTLRPRDVPEGPGEGGGESVERTLGLSEPLPLEQERIMRQLLEGFHKLIRYVARAAARPQGPAGEDGSDEKP
ncbi:MAG TPA: helix-turn-helix transcriptional regulator [Thermoanaerobaculia bacterium]